MTSNINIGLLGFGNVGASVYDLVVRNAAILTPKSPRPLAVSRIAVRDPLKPRVVRGEPVAPTLFTNDVLGVATDPDVAIVVELMGDCPQALEAMRAAIAAGKHVVTANKALIARHGPELFALALKNNVKILYEASVAGGIPVLRALREGLAANRIDWLRGIINGTCNYILSEMEVKGAGFDETLKKAQELGYAEADPASDVEGTDAAYKLCILVMLCYGVHVPVAEIFTQGITNVSKLDFEMARQFDYSIKLMGITRWRDDGIEARVHPVMVPRGDPIAHVMGAFNAIQYHGDYAGVGMLYGRGAGGAPTASAVVSDVLEACRSLEREDNRQNSPTGFSLREFKTISPLPMGAVRCAYYLRLTVVDKPNVLAQVTAILGRHGISIRNVYQHGFSEERRETPVVVFTHRALEHDMRLAVEAIDRLDSTAQPTQLMRIEEE